MVYTALEEHSHSEMCACYNLTMASLWTVVAAAANRGGILGHARIGLMSGIDTLSYLAMERTRTSREAVELMGSLASKYGPLDAMS